MKRVACLSNSSILLPLIILVMFGSVDLLYALYQWNTAAKAVEVGARIAAVWDPVAAGLNQLTSAVPVGLNASGRPLAMPQFTVACDGETATCTCAGTCAGMVTDPFDAVAMNRMYLGAARHSLWRCHVLLRNRHVRFAVFNYNSKCTGVPANRAGLCRSPRGTPTHHHRLAATHAVSVLFP